MNASGTGTRSRVATNAGANIVQMLVGSLLLFALYRYINAALGVALLGVWSVVVATVSASRLADLGLSAGVTRFVARDKADGDFVRATKVVDTALLTLMGSVGVLLPVAYYLGRLALPLFFEAENLHLAQGILPLALVSLWMTIVGSVFQGGLEGCQHMGMRAGLVVAGQAILLLLSVWLVPKQGLAGLAWAQIGQGIFLVVGGRLLLRSVLPGLPLLPSRWSKSVLREMLPYGANLQASTLFILLFDPAAKALMARFGGASSAGYFEMANQVVLRVRSVIVAANQAIVPHVAGWAGQDKDEIGCFYRENVRLLVAVTLPAASLLMAAHPIAGWALTSSYQPEFARDLVVLALVWGFNVLASPAYFINQGTGRVGANTLTHVITGAVSAALGGVLGWHFGAIGVLAGYAAGLTIGTSWLIGAFGRRHELPAMKSVDWNEHANLIGACVLVAGWAVCSLLYPPLVRIPVATAGLAIAVVLVAAAAWTHRLRRELPGRLAANVGGASR